MWLHVHKQKTSASLTVPWPVCNVLRYKFMKGSYTSMIAVTVELVRLVEILSSGEPSDNRIEKDSVSTSNTTITRKELNTCLHVNCACAMLCLNL